jgi:hypothetical protein
MSDSEDLEQIDRVGEAVRASLGSLTERRGAVRVGALRTIAGSLSNRYRLELVEDK